MCPRGSRRHRAAVQPGARGYARRVRLAEGDLDLGPPGRLGDRQRVPPAAGANSREEPDTQGRELPRQRADAPSQARRGRGRRDAPRVRRPAEDEHGRLRDEHPRAGRDAARRGAGSDRDPVPARTTSARSGISTRLNHPATKVSSTAERAFLARLDGNLARVPGQARIVDGAVEFEEAPSREPGRASSSRSTRSGSIEDAARIGSDAGLQIQKDAGMDFFHVAEAGRGCRRLSVADFSQTAARPAVAARAPLTRTTSRSAHNSRRRLRSPCAHEQACSGSGKAGSSW